MLIMNESQRSLGLACESSTNDKPTMHHDRAKKTVMVCHQAKTFCKRCLMILHTHPSLQIVDHYSMHVAQRKMALLGLFHYADAPVYIGRQMITQVIGIVSCKVGASIKSLMAHQHPLSE